MLPEEEQFINLARRVKAEGQVTVICGTHGRAVNARQKIYDLKKRVQKQALDDPEGYPPDTLNIVANISTQLPKKAIDLIVTDGSWLDKAFSDAINGKGNGR